MTDYDSSDFNVRPQMESTLSVLLAAATLIFSIIAVIFIIILVRPAHGQVADQHNLIRQHPRLSVLPLGASGDFRAPAFVLGGRPQECPRKYCGCILAIEFFGRPDPTLFVAQNWMRFPKTRPAPGMVAARKGHVMKLISHVRGKVWTVYDPNSGGGLTRVHDRSIAGFVIVDPTRRA